MLLLGALVALGLAFNPLMPRLKRVEAMENGLRDFQFEWRGKREPPAEIAILGVFASSRNVLEHDGVDAQTHPALGMMQPHWPWDRAFHAHVLHRLAEAGARAVVFDFVFAGPYGDGAGDWEFADAILEHEDKVVLGAMFVENQMRNVEFSTTLVEPYMELLPPDPDPVIGFVNQDPDADGVNRRARHGNSVLRMMNPHHPRADELPPDIYSLALRAYGKVAPVDWDDPAWGQQHIVNYYGPQHTFEIIPVENIFLPDRWSNRILQNGEYFKDKVVFFGPYDEIAFKDWHVTPFGRMPGVEIQATHLANLMEDNLLQDAPGWAEPLAGVLLVGLLLVVFIRLPGPWIKLVLLPLAAVGFVFFCQWLFEKHLLVLPMALPLLALGCYGAFDLTFNFVLEQYERVRTRSFLNRYVSENVADMLLRDRSSFEDRLKGEARPVTILFSDIRGFTTLTEKAMDDPGAFVATLNEYFRDMVDLVLQYEGTLSKFIGDAVMAVWGDAVSRGETQDAINAVRSAMLMTEALDKLNEGWLASGRLNQPLRIGIGVNSGPAIVGNIGHPQRLEFTVLGDSVNLAARLESATKYVHQDILVGDRIHELTSDQVLYRQVDRLIVKGKSIPIDVYAPVALKPCEPPAWLLRYEAALAAYLERRFSEAQLMFAEAADLRGEDGLCGVYIERCQHFVQSPPPEDWDGTYTLEGK